MCLATARRDAVEMKDGGVQVQVSARTVVRLPRRGGSNKTRFTLYTFVIHVAETQTWWIVRKRYSEFRDFQSKLMAMSKHCRGIASLQEHHDIVACVLALPFPSRNLFADTKAVKAARCAALGNITTHLVTLRMQAQALPPVFHTKLLQRHLDTFLDVPNFHRQVELTNIISPIKPQHICTICLETQVHGTIVALHCGHGFHQDCLLDWLSDNCTCPLCRKASLYGVLAPLTQA
ncbi:unnamed protein product [Aphanomyces euteiches]|uniref:RING-type domain-containing protein n=1 Tax=Aphanomyces euteiches TaxID=100861 RepID=A0A6G0XXX5_9STRA|nr:hypothetical protein Ae201684_000441 [Aphanomyces euteiches]KAH9092102.1 hypothetical protein Ae201684P_011637 [Aphanomyces euteiches]KAH9156284.1 hypothetical protein AeRB84_001781 [Aphanomyces euteiches]